MLKTLRNAMKVPDIRKKLFITFALLMVYRAGIFILVPGINKDAMAQYVSQGMLFGFLDLISGGGFKNFSIFALGIGPYINSSIIFSLLTVAIPKLEALSKEGEEGRKKIAEYTRYATVVLAIIEAFSISMNIRYNGVLTNNSWFWVFIIVLTLTAGSTFVMWLSEKITEFGIGNGASLIIFAGILSRLPSMGNSIAVMAKGGSVNAIDIILLILFALVLIAGVVTMDLAERRIPVQYAQRRVGTKSFGSQSSNIPINLNSAGVIGIIFALSVMQFPLLITQFFAPNSKARVALESGWLSPKKPLYSIIYILLILFFTWFYTSITFKPDEVADNLQKSGGFVPGIRPGKPTEEYITKILNRMTFVGGIFAAIIAVIPIAIEQLTPFQNLYLGGTSILIAVGVALEFDKQIEAQLVMRHYEGFLK